MLTVAQLKEVIHEKSLTRIDQALLCLGTGGGRALSTADVRSYAIQAGVKNAKKINYSDVLAKAAGKCFKTPAGWELTKEGKKTVTALAANALEHSPAAKEAKSLRVLTDKLKPEIQEFVKEAIICAEQSLFRAAVIQAWTGAIALLQDYVVANRLADFNTEAVRRDPKWKNAKTADDLGNMKESAFLDVLCSISVIGKNVKHDLEGCLKLRNGCGHPNSLKVGANKVAAHIETLVLNVYQKFS